MKQALLIVNPWSGQKRGVRAAKTISDKLGGHGIKSQVFVSQHVSALEAFLETCPLRDFDFAGLIGGDGTMHAFLNAILRKYPQVPLPIALFPCGTGNAFNFDIGCVTIDQTLNSIFENEPLFIDVAEIRTGAAHLWSFNILGCGLVAEINRLAEKMRWLGASRYNVASIIKLMLNPRSQMKITSDHGVTEGLYSFVLACNTRFTGKGMLMAPHAALNDGKFDVIVVRACSALKLLSLFPKIFKGKHLGADVLSYLQTSRLEVSSPAGSLPTNIDGELKGHTPLSLKVHSDKVRVFMHPRTVK